MATANRFRRQAATCANLAAQAHDEISRERYRQLAQTFLDFAEAEEQPSGRSSAAAAEGERTPAP